MEVQAGAAQESLDRLVGRADARALALLALVGRASGQPVDGERQAARRGEGLGPLVDEAGIDQGVGDELLQVVGRAPLHARRDFLGEEFKQKVGHTGILASDGGTKARKFRRFLARFGAIPSAGGNAR